MFGKGKPIEIKSVDELALMRQAGLVVAKTLEKIRSEIAVGMTTADLSCATPAAALASILDLRIYLHIVTRLLIGRVTSAYFQSQ